MNFLVRQIRNFVEVMGAIQVLVTVGMGTVIGSVAAGAMQVAWPFRILLFAGVLMLAAAGMVAGWRWIADKSMERRLAVCVGQPSTFMLDATTPAIVVDLLLTNRHQEVQMSLLTTFHALDRDGRTVPLQSIDRRLAMTGIRGLAQAEGLITLAPRDSYSGRFAVCGESQGTGFTRAILTLQELVSQQAMEVELLE